MGASLAAVLVVLAVVPWLLPFLPRVISSGQVFLPCRGAVVWVLSGAFSCCPRRGFFCPGLCPPVPS